MDKLKRSPAEMLNDVQIELVEKECLEIIIFSI